MKNTSAKVVNRYYQVDGLTPRGSIVATIFCKANSVEEVRAQLAKSSPLYQMWPADCHRHGVFSGKSYDTTATRFKVSPVCWRYAMACACGGFDLTKERTAAERRRLSREFADYLFHNSDPCIEHARRPRTA